MRTILVSGAANGQKSSGPIDFSKAAADHNSGNSTPQNQRPMFGGGLGMGASTTPAGEPKQQGGLFGGSGTTGGGLFGGGGGSSNTGGGFKFGQSATNSSTSGAGGLFGGQDKIDGEYEPELKFLGDVDAKR